MDCASFWFVGSTQRNSHKYGYQSWLWGWRKKQRKDCDAVISYILCHRSILFLDLKLSYLHHNFCCSPKQALKLFPKQLEYVSIHGFLNGGTNAWYHQNDCYGIHFRKCADDWEYDSRRKSCAVDVTCIANHGFRYTVIHGHTTSLPIISSA